MRLGGEVASGTILAQHFLDEGQTYPEDVGNGALRAELPLAGSQDFLTEIDRIGSHTIKTKIN
jgi:hypothetical protein